MGKLPAIQFYPADWRKDPGVQALDYFEKGVWFEMLLIMHESKNRGFLQINGQKIEEKMLARMLGVTLKKTQKVLKTLVLFDVYSVDGNGVIYSRRMVYDERIRQIRIKAGKTGGKANASNLLKQNDKQSDPPSSSSSSSSSITEENTNTPLPPKRGKRLTETQKKLIKIGSNTLNMIRIGEWFGRNTGTLWSLYEAERIELLEPINGEDLDLLEKYYTADINKADDRRRQDIGTLFNNWTGELDRARKFTPAHQHGDQYDPNREF